MVLVQKEELPTTQNSGIHVHIHMRAVVWPSVNVPGCLCQYQRGRGGISPTQVDMKYCANPQAQSSSIDVSNI